MEPLVSIITRTRDRPRLLPRAIESVRAQTESRWEHWIVNDGGDPAGVEALLAEATGPAGDERVHLLHRPTSTGMEAATNAALEAARGAWIAIHDDDDRWHPDFLEAMLAAAEASPLGERLGGIVCHTTRVVERWATDRFETTHEHPFNAWLSDPVALWRMAQENAFPPISLLVRRAAGDAVGWFDPSLPVLGDWEFNLRLLRQFEIAVHPAPLAFYHHREAATTGADANTVTAGHTLHRTIEADLRRRWRASADPYWRQVALLSETGPERLQLAAHLARLESETNHLRAGLARIESAFPP